MERFRTIALWMDEPTIPQVAERAPYVIVAGFGLPGRSLVDILAQQKIDYTVIELNAQTCQRAAAGGIHIMPGSAADEETLRQAQVERATLVALMVPNDEVVLAAISFVRRVNRDAHVIARCSFTSTGLEAIRRGANESIVAEQVIARELEHIARGLLAPAPL
jgi:Trk K+ transport system NAD-binding subunit